MDYKECAQRVLDLVGGPGNVESFTICMTRLRLNLANILDDASSAAIATFVVGSAPTLDNEFNERLQVLVDAQADVCARRGVTYVDCFRPLLGHDQWQADLAASPDGLPGQAGYGLIAWLVLHSGFGSWLGTSR